MLVVCVLHFNAANVQILCAVCERVTIEDKKKVNLQLPIGIAKLVGSRHSRRTH